MQCINQQKQHAVAERTLCYQGRGQSICWAVTGSQLAPPPASIT